MGCDIHICVEKKHNGKWVMVNRIDGRARMRNYERFAALAGARGKGPAARGLPEDIPESAQMFVDEWEGDGHNHSWYPVKEMADIMVSTNDEVLSDFDKEFPLYYFFKIESRGKPNYHEDYRAIFFFDC